MHEVSELCGITLTLCSDVMAGLPMNFLSLMAECRKQMNVDLPIMFTSTSKDYFSRFRCSCNGCFHDNHVKVIKNRLPSIRLSAMIKMNMLRHARFFGDLNGVKSI